MNARAAGIKLLQFGAEDPLLQLPESDQILYLRDYLTELGATTVLEESAYFDRDYLSEFAAFYATSARGYPNCCRRLHYFSGPLLTQARLEEVLGGDEHALTALQQSYLGFVVVRPIPAAPLGRTVLCWYNDTKPQTPRVVSPSQMYEVYVAGVKLSVCGLAWQQQDSAVGACATVALWSMMHASAFDPHHAIPTTADLTRFANRTASLGSRVFPSQGLSIEQILEAIKETGLVPAVVQANDIDESIGVKGFTRERFSSSCAALIRAGYPVLLAGALIDDANENVVGRHAVCAVGFRESAAQKPKAGETRFQDEGIQHIYLHDDNIGPNARFEVTDGQTEGRVTRLVRAPPPSVNPGAPSKSGALSYPTFIPQSLVVAVHEDLRTAPDELNKAGLRAGDNLCRFLQPVIPNFGVTLTARFARLPEYLGPMLERTLRSGPGGAAVLAKTRLALCEKFPPMSFHLGLVRLGLGAVPLLDILFDMTDNARHLQPIGHVAYQKGIPNITSAMRDVGMADFGVCVEAY